MAQQRSAHRFVSPSTANFSVPLAAAGGAREPRESSAVQVACDCATATLERSRHATEISGRFQKQIRNCTRTQPPPAYQPSNVLFF